MEETKREGYYIYETLGFSNINGFIREIAGSEKLTEEEKILEEQYAEEYQKDYESFFNRQDGYKYLISQEGHDSKRGIVLKDLLNDLKSEYEF